jgi:predicted ester cyclase
MSLRDAAASRPGRRAVLVAVVGPVCASVSDPEHVVPRLIDEAFSNGRLAVADELVAEDILEHQDFGPGHAPGAESVKAVICSLRHSFPDFRLTIEDLVVVGDTVWTRNVATGTQDGPFAGNPPTGRPIRIAVFDVLRVVDGRIVEHWGVPDRLGALLQIGAAQPTAPRALSGVGVSPRAGR